MKFPILMNYSKVFSHNTLESICILYKRRCKEISPPTSAPYTSVASPTISIPNQSGMFVTIDEPALTHYNHPKSIVCIMIRCWCGHSVGLDTCVRTCIHHYDIIHSIFTALNIHCALSIHPPILSSW